MYIVPTGHSLKGRGDQGRTTIRGHRESESMVKIALLFRLLVSEYEIGERGLALLRVLSANQTIAALGEHCLKDTFVKVVDVVSESSYRSAEASFNDCECMKANTSRSSLDSNALEDSHHLEYK